jgi:hypothetical protein
VWSLCRCARNLTLAQRTNNRHQTYGVALTISVVFVVGASRVFCERDATIPPRCMMQPSVHLCVHDTDFGMPDTTIDPKPHSVL